ncbi:hypothetical protein L2E82_16365 [Cichorium intybus]|uniref:Uncharacterized protein n=1 Tax=Cichorium intybus TaxID=13427 RepID=A0ACB9F5T1_CICIN|nr:hypothetical protein L2E82_16365 [Cichorium intybus]
MLKGILVKVEFVTYDESVRIRKLVVWCTLVHFFIQFGAWLSVFVMQPVIKYTMLKLQIKPLSVSVDLFRKTSICST